MTWTVGPVVGSMNQMKTTIDPKKRAISASGSGRNTARSWTAEFAIAGLLFAIALANFVIVVRAGFDAWSAIVVFVALAAAYLGLSVGALRLRMARAISWPAVGALLPPALLLVVVAVAAPMPRTLAIYAAWLFVPVIVALQRHDSAITALAAAALLWLPLELRLVPPLPLPAGSAGFDASHLVGLVNGLCLFLLIRPLGGIGFSFLLRGRDVALAVAAFAVYAVVALPAGLETSFLRWHPQLSAGSLVGAPWAIYLGTAVPEEFLFRGVIQNACARAIGPPAALATASVIFGLAHLPDPRYAALATLAGLAYGWVYLRTGKITASAITHALVDWVWLLLLRT